MVNVTASGRVSLEILATRNDQAFIDDVTILLEEALATKIDSIWLDDLGPTSKSSGAVILNVEIKIDETKINNLREFKIDYLEDDLDNDEELIFRFTKIDME